jgi:polyhydroxyalkanoate synthesis regulator phasin
MTERTTLLKKAVLTSVGATASVERIKTALNDAMQDLVKVGNDLLDDLEVTGKNQTASAQDFIKSFQTEAGKRTTEIEKTVSDKMQEQVKKTAREFGLATRDEVEEILDRLHELEESAGIVTEHETEGEHHTGERKRSKRKKSS